MLEHAFPDHYDYTVEDLDFKDEFTGVDDRERCGKVPGLGRMMGIGMSPYKRN